MSYEIVPAEAKHVGMMADHLREGDIGEIGIFGLSPRAGLWKSYRSSPCFRYTAFVDGEIAAMYGCSGQLLSVVGHPWLLTTPQIERAMMPFAREARKAVEDMNTLHPYLFNLVAAEYRKAVGFLRLLGFVIGEPFPYGPQGQLLCSFERRR